MCTKSGKSSYTNAFMVPSSIYYIYSEPNNIMSHAVDQRVIDVSRKILQTGDLPKLQVVEKEGNWFTLNNAQLDLCRRLEEDGKCKKVKVDIVPLRDVPRSIRGMMTVPNKENKGTEDKSSSAPDPSRMTTKGYERLDQTEGAESSGHVTDSEADESLSDSSDFLESESECDWSDNEESSEIESTDTEASQSTDDERECLL